MKNLAFILAVAAILLNATNSLASDTIKPWDLLPGDTIKLLSNEEFFAKADYIIEVKSAGFEFITFYDAGGNYNPNDIYTSVLMIVTAVYKNDETLSVSPGDTINHIRKGGMVLKPFSEEYPWDVEQIWSPRPVDYDTGDKESAMTDGSIIFFMKKSDLPENPDVSKRSKHPKVSMLQDIARASIKIGGIVPSLNGLYFENRYEIYKYMEQFEGITVPLSDPEQMWGDLHLYPEVFDQYRKERKIDWKKYSERTQEDVDSLMRFLEMKVRIATENREKKKREQGMLKAPAANNILTVTIQNQVVRYEPNGKYYFIFDVYVNANNFSTYLDNLVLRLNYNTTAFGTNIKANNKVTLVSIGTEFNTSTYTLSGYVYDATSNSLNLGVGVNTVANLTRTLLTTSPVKLLNVKIELLNGLTGVSSGINFTDVANTSSFSMFTPASNTPWNDPNFWLYDTTNYVNPSGFTIYTVAPTLSVSPFSTTTTRAGTGETITISGNNFGTQKGQVLFTKARSGITGNTIEYLKGLDESYIESWTNTQIKVKVPSFVRKGYINSQGNTTTDHGSGAGSGQIKVRTARNDSVISTSSLNIEYSVKNGASNTLPDTDPIRRIYLARLTNCDDIVFSLHQNLSSNTAARNAVEAAFQKWSDLLKIRLVLEKNGSNPAYATGFVSGKNVIGFSSTVPGKTAAEFTGMAALDGSIPQGILADGINTEYFRNYGGAHIYIKDSPTYPWDYKTTIPGTVYAYNLGFYNGILHELGHVLNLNHVNDENDLMYYTINEKPNQNYPVINLTATSKPVVGAINTAEASKKIIWKPNQARTIITLGSNAYCTITSVTTPDLAFSTPYPNPAQNSFFIHCEGAATIKLYDILGREMLSQTAKGQTEVDISRLPQGVYNIAVLSEGKITGNNKIVKQ